MNETLHSTSYMYIHIGCDLRALFLSHLVRRASVEEAGVIVDDTSELGSVQEQHKEEELLQNVL